MNRTMLVLTLTALLATPASADRRHTVVPRDTMWDLAHFYYQDNFKWRRIAEANPPPNVHDPHWIYPGQVLIIPDIDGEEPQLDADTPPPQVFTPAVFKPDQGRGVETSIEESLSTRLPAGLVAAPPSNYRMRALEGFKPQGVVVGLDGREALAAEGDPIDVEIEPGAVAGERFSVYRKAAPAETDKDQNATYVVKIGVVQIKKQLAGKTFRAVILKSVDSLQLSDILVKGE